MSTRAADRRRGRTLWLLLTPLVGLIVIVGGVWALQEAHPVVEESLFVTGVPALALEEVTTCTRQNVDDGATALREQWVDGGRISSTQILACPEAYDLAEVVFVGEVVGEVITRRDGAWVQVNDDAYALRIGPLVAHRQLAGSNTGMAVWIPEPLVDAIEVVGRAGVRGDVLQVTGIVRRADPADGGGLTIRAMDLTVLADGQVIDEPLHSLQAVVAVVLALAAIGAAGWAWRVRQR